jgi:Na+/H+ antiporter NhaD/arsenite permease-like protein
MRKNVNTKGVKRYGMADMVCGILFLIVYAIIISEKIHRTIIALFGAALLIVLGVISQHEAISYIDFNTIGLLFGMMVIVGITRKSGVFEFVAIKAAHSTGGDPVRIMIALSIVTAIASALLDNVTTVLLIVPVTISICAALEVNPVPIFIAEIISSNIGGTATLIGDPPNIRSAVLPDWDLWISLSTLARSSW